MSALFFFFFFQAEDGIRDLIVTGVQTCALPILILIGLFLVQSRGTARIGAVFGPVMLVWFATIDRKSVVEGKSVDLGGCRIIKKKKNANVACHVISCLSG